MSSRYWRRYVAGNPQRRVFLPNFWMKLVKSSLDIPANEVHFKVAPQMTNNDVRNYLEKIYKVPVVQVNSIIKCGEIGIANIPKVSEKIIKKSDDYRLVFVKLPTNVVFKFPDLFPERKEKEELKDLKALKEDYERSLQEVKNKNWDRKDVPSWFSL